MQLSDDPASISDSLVSVSSPEEQQAPDIESPGGDRPGIGGKAGFSPASDCSSSSSHSTLSVDAGNEAQEIQKIDPEQPEQPEQPEPSGNFTESGDPRGAGERKSLKISRRSSKRSAQYRSSASPYLRSIPRRSVSKVLFRSQQHPSAGEIEEFLAGIEEKAQNCQQQLVERYNFDFVNEVPLLGRYEWTKVHE